MINTHNQDKKSPISSIQTTEIPASNYALLLRGFRILTGWMDYISKTELVSAFSTYQISSHEYQMKTIQEVTRKHPLKSIVTAN